MFRIIEFEPRSTYTNRLDCEYSRMKFLNTKPASDFMITFKCDLRGNFMTNLDGMNREGVLGKPCCFDDDDDDSIRKVYSM